MSLTVRVYEQVYVCPITRIGNTLITVQFSSGLDINVGKVFALRWLLVYLKYFI